MIEVVSIRHLTVGDAPREVQVLELVRVEPATLDQRQTQRERHAD